MQEKVQLEGRRARVHFDPEDELGLFVVLVVIVVVLFIAMQPLL